MVDNYKENIKEYFKKNLKKGYTSEALKGALINQGYSRIVVESILDKVHKESSKEAPIFKEKPAIRYEVIDEYNNPVFFKKPWWKKLFRL